MKNKKQKLPKKIFVAVRGEGADQFLLAETTVEKTAEENCITDVGVYELVETLTVSTLPTIVPKA